VAALKQRIKELEITLAMAKVAQVEAECENQNLKHQLSSLNSNRGGPVAQGSNSWRQRLDAVVSSVNIPAMNINISSTIPSFQSHISDLTQQSSATTTCSTATTTTTNTTITTEESK
jgi:hypothetical protein